MLLCNIFISALLVQLLLPFLVSGFVSSRTNHGAATRVPFNPSVVVVSSRATTTTKTTTIKTRKTTTTTSLAAVGDDESGFLDYLKWDGQEPSFDVLELAKKYTSEPGYRAFRLRDIPADYYSDDYVFRGPIVGPMIRKDLVETNTNFRIDKAFPDLDREVFGLCVDPENPFRVLFFERWKATNTGVLDRFPPLKPTGKRSVSPVMPFSINFTPDGRIIYEALTTAVDRFEGENTGGKVAVFGLLETAGLSLPNGVGNPLLVAGQKLNRSLGLVDVQTDRKSVV